MRGSRILRYAGVLLAATAMLPALAVAQNDSGPQRIPGLDRFSLPPKPTPTPAPPPSGPIIAPLARPTPAPAPSSSAVVPPPVSTTTGAPATARPTPRPGTAQPAPVTNGTAAPQSVASATPAPPASSAPAPTAEPTGATTGATIPVSIAPSGGWSIGTLIAVGVGVLALLGGAFFLFRRRRRQPELEEELELTEVALPPPPPPAPPSPHLTVPLRPRGGTGLSQVAEPEIEIVLIPRRAGTNLMNAAVDYRVLLRNNGKGEARDVRFGIYLFSASARQAADLQMIFATTVESPVVPPFTLAPGQEVELAGMAQLARDNVNVMTIEGKPWFVPVMALKVEYRWGENVGAPGVATAAHMIGIDRGEGAKMQPFRLDGGPMMHPEVAQRKVA